MPLLDVQGPIGQVVTLVTSDQVPVPARLVAGAGAVDATAVTYTPTDPTVWTIPAPVNVQQALDQLASTKGTFARNLARVPLVGEQQVSSLGPFAVAPQKSGVYLVWAAVEVHIPAAVAGAESILSIVVDSVAQGQPLGNSYTVGEASFTASQLALVTVNRAVSHNWELLIDTGSAPGGHVELERGKLLLLEL